MCYTCCTIHVLSALVSQVQEQKSHICKVLWLEFGDFIVQCRTYSIPDIILSYCSHQGTAICNSCACAMISLFFFVAAILARRFFHKPPNIAIPTNGHTVRRNSVCYTDGLGRYCYWSYWLHILTDVQSLKYHYINADTIIGTSRRYWPRNLPSLKAGPELVQK